MVQINYKTSEIPDHDLFISLASVGLLLCMVVTLMGIKFRWFKHRLTFENTPSNGTIGINRVSFHDLSSQKHSKHFLEPVVVHGVFRKRLEDDLDYERPKSLPPIRIRKSSNGPSLLPNAKRKEVHSENLETFEPPPAPPLPASLASSSNNSPKLSTKKDLISLNETSTSKEQNIDFPVPKARTYTTSLENNFNDITEEVENNSSVTIGSLDRSKSSNFDFICDVGNKNESGNRPSGFVHFVEESNVLEKEIELPSHHKVTFEVGNDNDDYDQFDHLKIKSDEEVSEFLSISNDEIVHTKLHRTTKNYNENIFELEEKNDKSEFLFENAKFNFEDKNATAKNHKDLTTQDLIHDFQTEKEQKLDLLSNKEAEEHVSNSLDKPRTLRDMMKMEVV